MNDNTTDKRFFTAAEAAAILGVSKATILRNLDQLPQVEQAQGTYRNQPTRLVTEAGLMHLAVIISAASVNYELLNEAIHSESSESFTASSAAKRNEANQGDIVDELRARIRAQDDEIRFLRDELKARRRELEALTTTNYLLLTAAQSAQDEGEPGEGTDTTPAADEAQDTPSTATVDGATVEPVEITRNTAPGITVTDDNDVGQVKPKAGFWRRLQYLFRGE